MSAIGDALNSLKSVMLMQERIDGLRGDIGRVSADLRTLAEKVGTINDRMSRLEGVIEGAAMASRQRRIQE